MVTQKLQKFLKTKTFKTWFFILTIDGAEKFELLSSILVIFAFF